MKSVCRNCKFNFCPGIRSKIEDEAAKSDKLASSTEKYLRVSCIWYGRRPVYTKGAFTWIFEVLFEIRPSRCAVIAYGEWAWRWTPSQMIRIVSLEVLLEWALVTTAKVTSSFRTSVRHTFLMHISHVLPKITRKGALEDAIIALKYFLFHMTRNVLVQFWLAVELWRTYYPRRVSSSVGCMPPVNAWV